MVSYDFEASGNIHDLAQWQALIQKHGSFEKLLIKVNQKAAEVARSQRG